VKLALAAPASFFSPAEVSQAVFASCSHFCIKLVLVVHPLSYL
jgi:hypothetical protein